MVTREFIQSLERKIRNLEAKNQTLKQYELENKVLKNHNKTLNKRLRRVKHVLTVVSDTLEDL